MKTLLSSKKNKKSGLTLLACCLIAFSLFSGLSLSSCSDNNTKVEVNNSGDDSDETPQDSINTAKTDFSIKRGVNIGNWLSQSDLRGAQRTKIFTQADVEKLASYGFDHLRLPVDEEQLFGEDGTIDKETMNLVHNVIGWCKNNNMKVIFDLHIIRSHNFGNDNNPLWAEDDKERDKLMDMWKKIDNELKQYPPQLVAYELLNEPIAPDYSQWNSLVSRFIAQIRETDSRRVLVIEANSWGNVGNINLLNIPANEQNMILEFHFYEPYLLTHYQASWTDFKDFKQPGDKLHYPGELVPKEFYDALTPDEQKLVDPYKHTYSKETIQQDWQKAIDFAKEKGLKLYCGEFGCLPNCGQTNRLAWTEDIVDLCLKNDIAYSYWEYNNIFGFADRNQGNIVTNQELLDCLTK